MYSFSTFVFSAINFNYTKFKALINCSGSDYFCNLVINFALNVYKNVEDVSSSDCFSYCENEKGLLQESLS